jgi:thiamine biosynthesis lipoprotein
MEFRRSTFEAIGTVWEISVRDTMDDEAWIELMQKIYLRMQSFDRAFSRFRSDSLVTHIAHNPGTYDLPCEGVKMIRFYEALYEVTYGKVTPLIGETMTDAGYDASYSFKKKMLKTPPKWEDVLSYDHTSVTVTSPVMLDFGAAGKGYLVDLVARLIDEAGLRSYIVNAGGDILHRNSGSTKLEAGLENPLDITQAIGIVSVGNQSLCASAGSKRKWEDVNHIIDPFTLVSPEDIIATWVLADDTMTADGLATALFFTDPSHLLKRFPFAYAMLAKDMGLSYTKNFPIKIFEAEQHERD